MLSHNDRQRDLPRDIFQVGKFDRHWVALSGADSRRDLAGQRLRKRIVAAHHAVCLAVVLGGAP